MSRKPKDFPVLGSRLTAHGLRLAQRMLPIGAGIFINPYIVARRLDSEALVLAAWVVGGAIAIAGAFAFAELASLFPRAGGEYVYLREAYHPLIGFLFGWASLLMIQGGGIAAVAITFAQYTLRLAGPKATGRA